MNLTILKKLAGVFSALAVVSSVSAVPTEMWMDRDPDNGNGPLQFLSENGTTYYQSTFNILDAGFDPLVYTITSVTVDFWFADSQDDSYEYVDIWVAGQKIQNDWEFDGNHSNAPYSYDHFTMDISGWTAIVDDLSADGIVTYKVKIQDLISSTKSSKIEDGWLKIAKLTAHGERTNVPDAGATLGLMGLAFVALGAIRRKMGR